jgi:hypothetical protein
MVVQSSVLLVCTLIAGIFFLAMTMRRWIYLNKKDGRHFNSFWAMAIFINAWLPFSIAYYSLILVRVYIYPSAIGNSKTNLCILTSTLHGISNIVLGLSYGPLLVDWLKLSRRHDGDDENNGDVAGGNNTIAIGRKGCCVIHSLSSTMYFISRTKVLFVAITLFILATLSTAIASGTGMKSYSKSFRIYCVAWSLYLCFCSILLVYGGLRIKTMTRAVAKLSPRSSPMNSTASNGGGSNEEFGDSVLKNASSSSSSMSSSTATTSSSLSNNVNSEEEVDSAEMVVKEKINRLLGIVVLVIYIPLCIANVIRAILIRSIDANVWATAFFTCFNALISIAYVLFWGFTFWTETTSLIYGSKKHNDIHHSFTSTSSSSSTQESSSATTMQRIKSKGMVSTIINENKECIR